MDEVEALATIHEIKAEPAKKPVGKKGLANPISFFFAIPNVLQT